MAPIALSLSVTLGTLNFSGAARQYGNLFPGSSRKLGTNLCRLSSFQGKGIRRAISSSSKNNGGVAEISESELAKRFYAWPDYKCVIQEFCSFVHLAVSALKQIKGGPTVYDIILVHSCRQRKNFYLFQKSHWDVKVGMFNQAGPGC